DVVVLPSYSEGIPNVLREGLACGRPFVATNLGGIAELADPSWSRLIAPGDPIALADALEEMMDNPLGVDPQLVQRKVMSWEESAGQLVRLLNEIIGKHKAPQYPHGDRNPNS